MTNQQQIDNKKQHSTQVLLEIKPVIPSILLEYYTTYFPENTQTYEKIFTSDNFNIISTETTNEKLSKHLDIIGIDALLTFPYITIGLSHRYHTQKSLDILTVNTKRNNIIVNEFDKLKLFQDLQSIFNTTLITPAINIQTRLDQNNKPKMIVMTTNEELITFIEKYKHVLKPNINSEDGSEYIGICKKTADEKGLKKIIKEVEVVTRWVTV